MIDFYQAKNCKICNQSGKSIYLKKYNDEKLRLFFINYYGEIKYESFKQKLLDVDYELLKCSDCNFVWQKNTPKKNFSIELYDNIIDNDESLKKSELKFINQKKSNYKEIKKIISNFDNETINILDYGAGWGHWLMSGSGLSYKPYAFELSSNRIKFLSSNKIEVLNFEKINVYKNVFHYVRLDQVLEHLDEPKDALNIIKKLGAKNCIYFISVPDGTEIINKERILDIKKGPVQPLEHLNCFSKKSLKKILHNNGFRPLNFTETVIMNLKDFQFNLTSLKSLLLDLRNYFFSTSIKFKLK